jgi:hypothetical protein
LYCPILLCWWVVCLPETACQIRHSSITGLLRPGGESFLMGCNWQNIQFSGFCIQEIIKSVAAKQLFFNTVINVFLMLCYKFVILVLICFVNCNWVDTPRQ